MRLVEDMRLLTHNMLASHVKGVKNGFPLAIEVSSGSAVLFVKLD